MQDFEKFGFYLVKVTNFFSPSFGHILPVGDITLREDLYESLHDFEKFRIYRVKVTN